MCVAGGDMKLLDVVTEEAHNGFQEKSCKGSSATRTAGMQVTFSRFRPLCSTWCAP